MKTKICVFIMQCLFIVGFAQQNINSIEYYFDADPGVGNATTVTITANESINDSYTLPIGNLTEGFHTLYIRAKDDANVWGLYDRRVFYVTAAALSNNATLTNMEYFFDTDPGVGNGTALSLPTNPSAENMFDIDVSSLQEGSHLLFIRAKNSADIWGINAMAAFTIDNSLSVKDFSNQVSVYPNAFQDKITIQSTLEIESYQLYDVTGKIVLQQKMESNEINTQSLSKGTYFLVLNSTVGKAVKKVIKE